MLLCIDVRAYLPDPTLITIYFIKDLIAGIRKFLKQEDVKHLYVPFYENLTIKVMINWASTRYPELGVYFPIEKEQAKLPRVSDDYFKLIIL